MFQNLIWSSTLQESFSFHLPHTVVAAGHSTLKIDLMKPALYEETFIRSVEYITIIIMPKSSSSTSFLHFRHMSKTDAVRHSIFYNDDFIIRPCLLKVTQLWCSTCLLSLKSLSTVSPSWLLKADEPCKHSVDVTYWCAAMFHWIFIVFNWSVNTAVHTEIPFGFCLYLLWIPTSDIINCRV